MKLLSPASLFHPGYLDVHVSKLFFGCIFVGNGVIPFAPDRPVYESGPMQNQIVRRQQSLKLVRIPVTDCNGDKIDVYQREHRVRVPILGCQRKMVSYELDTGERVELLDDDTFALQGSGGTFFRIK